MNGSFNQLQMTSLEQEEMIQFSIYLQAQEIASTQPMLTFHYKKD